MADVVITTGHSSPAASRIGAVVRLSVMMYIHYPPSLRQIKVLLFERGMDIRDETVRIYIGPKSEKVRAQFLSLRHNLKKFFVPDT